MDTNYYNKCQELEIKIFKLYFKISFEYIFFKCKIKLFKKPKKKNSGT